MRGALGAGCRARAQRLDLDEHQGPSVDRDQVELAADRRGAGVAGDDPQPHPLERVGDQRLRGAAEPLARTVIDGHATPLSP